jgi:hypothetical protein
MRVGGHREQELKRMSDLVVRTVRDGQNRARETPCNDRFASRSVEISPESGKNVMDFDAWTSFLIGILYCLGIVRIP